MFNFDRTKYDEMTGYYEVCLKLSDIYPTIKT